MSLGEVRSSTSSRAEGLIRSEEKVEGLGARWERAGCSWLDESEAESFELEVGSQCGLETVSCATEWEGSGVNVKHGLVLSQPTCSIFPCKCKSNGL